jgi:hypothetical protein
LFLDGIWELHAFVREELYAVVLIGIVGSGNDNTNMKIVLAHETGDTGSSENSGKGNGSATVDETGRDDRSDVGTGFASIGADQSMGRRVIAMQVFRDRTAKREEGIVIEGRCAGDAANTVRTKKLSRHRVIGRRERANKKFSTAIAESRGVGG